jgi:hypothetical protein
MRVIAGNKNNIFTWTFDSVAKTLSISNVTEFDLNIESLLSVYDVTTGSMFAVNSPLTTFSWNYVAGRKVFTYTFGTVPAGSANADVLQIYLDIPDSKAVYSILKVIATATI